MDDNLSKKIQNLSTRLKGISDNITSFSQIFDSYADGIITKLGLIDGSIKTMDGNQQTAAELLIDAIYEVSDANGEKIDALIDAINTQGGELVAAIDGNGQLIVGAIGANGTAISNAITTQGQAVVAEITNLKKVVKNQLEGINTTLKTNNDKLDLTNGNLSNIQGAIANNATALTNIFNAVDDINDNLEDIAGALGAIDTEALVEAVGKIATNTEGVGTAVVGIKTDFDTLNGMLAQSGVPQGFAAIVEQLRALNGLASQIGTGSSTKMETLLAVLRKINSQLKDISDQMP